MNMLGELMGGLFDKEKETFETIQETLQDLAKELNCVHSDFFIRIKAIDETCTPRLDVFKLNAGKAEYVREITLKEILGVE